MLLIILTSYLSAAFAVSSPACTSFRLDEPGGTMANVPQYRQLFGICYTATGMDLVRAFGRERRGASPLAAAIEASTRLDRPVREDPVKLDTYPFENGFTCDALNRLRHRGFCSAEAMAKAFPEGEDFAIEKMYADFKRLAATHRAACAAGPLRRSMASLDKVLGKAYEKNAPLAYFQRRLAEICPPSRRIGSNTPECFEHAVTGADHFRSIFRHHFDRLGKYAQPMEIGFCPDVQSEGPGYAGVISKAVARPGSRYDLCQGFDPADPEDDGTHSATVIGRRLADGRCQVLIKQSTGSSCLAAWSNHWECHDGKIWIDEDALARNVTSVSRLGRPFSAR